MKRKVIVENIFDLFELFGNCCSVPRDWATPGNPSLSIGDALLLLIEDGFDKSFDLYLNKDQYIELKTSPMDFNYVNSVIYEGEIIMDDEHVLPGEGYLVSRRDLKFPMELEDETYYGVCKLQAI